MIEISDDLRAALASRPVLAQGQADDLVLEADVAGTVRPPDAWGRLRVWLSRVDGTVSVEVQGFDGSWRPAHDEDEPVLFKLALLETLGTEWIGGIW